MRCRCWPPRRWGGRVVCFFSCFLFALSVSWSPTASKFLLLIGTWAVRRRAAADWSDLHVYLQTVFFRGDFFVEPLLTCLSTIPGAPGVREEKITTTGFISNLIIFSLIVYSWFLKIMWINPQISYYLSSFSCWILSLMIKIFKINVRT